MSVDLQAGAGAGGEAVSRRPRGARRALAVAVPLFFYGVLFLWAWLYRYNDPEGGLSGILDDHFFYLVRGWQILYGDLPDRDFVDPGAPLTFVLGAGVQWLLGRGTWSETVFCVTALSVSSVVTYVIARRAAGSMLIGLAAALFQVALSPRLYNYPKVVVYAVAIPALWAFIDAPTRWRRFALAALTVVALLLRHDHGVFVGGATVLAIALLTQLSWRKRIRHAIVYGLLVLALASPYLVYLQVNGGVVTHFVTANSWSQRDRARAPLLLPTFSLSPRPDEDPPAADAEWWLRGIFVQPIRNYEPWLFWLLVALPVMTLAVLPVSADGFRPRWPRARSKIAIVAVLAIVLDVGFLRGNLTSRVGDVSVTSAVLAAWLLRAGWTFARRGEIARGARTLRVPMLVRAPALVVLLATAGVTTLVLIPSVRERLDHAGMTERPLGVFDRFGVVTRRLQTWPLEFWSSPDAEGSMRLAFYLRDCTAPTDRVFISQYMPQVAALAQRAFAGGHGDLRPSFFTSPADQRLTLARLERQRVPIAIVPAGGEYEGFRKDFPRIDAYLATRYLSAGDVDLGGRVRVRLLVSRDMVPTGQYRQQGWPCFR